ncbi:MAG: DUF5063 domain-containing protein [Actinomycetota bacterium]
MDPVAERFAHLAERFVAHVDDSPLTGPAWLEATATALTRLVAAAVDLPDLEPTPESHDHIQKPPSRRARIAAALDGDDLYWTVLDQGTFADEAALGAGNLVDDVVEVCDDLEKALHLWRAGDRIDAIWEWRFGYRTHWGPHAHAALVVMLDRLR